MIRTETRETPSRGMLEEIAAQMAADLDTQRELRMRGMFAAVQEMKQKAARGSKVRRSLRLEGLKGEQR